MSQEMKLTTPQLNKVLIPSLSSSVRMYGSKKIRPEKKLAYHSDSDSDSDGEHFRRVMSIPLIELLLSPRNLAFPITLIRILTNISSTFFTCQHSGREVYLDSRPVLLFYKYKHKSYSSQQYRVENYSSMLYQNLTEKRNFSSSRARLCSQ